MLLFFFFSGITPDFFSLSGDTTVGAKRGAGPCNMASVMFTAAMDVQINTGVDSTNYFCGGQLNVMSGALSGVVRCKFYLYILVVKSQEYFWRKDVPNFE